MKTIQKFSHFLIFRLALILFAIIALGSAYLYTSHKLTPKDALAVAGTLNIPSSQTLTTTTMNVTNITLGGTAVTASGLELNHLSGVTSNLQTQLNLKSPKADPTFTGTVTMPANVVGLTKAMVGLANVDNTSDANKPVSTAQAAADALKAPITSPTFVANTISPYYDVIAGNGQGLRFWQSDAYKIHMGSGAEYFYGPVTDYSIKMNMGNGAGRGFTWGATGLAPVAALNATSGNFQTAGTVTAPTFVANNTILTTNRLYMNSGTNLHLDSFAGGITYINYYSGTGGVNICNGASACGNIYWDAANTGLRVPNNYLINGDIYFGSRGAWLSTWLNQALLTTSNPTFAGAIVGGGSSSNWATVNIGGANSINTSGNIYSYSRICAGNASGACDGAGGAVLNSNGTITAASTVTAPTFSGNLVGSMDGMVVGNFVRGTRWGTDATYDTGALGKGSNTPDTTFALGKSGFIDIWGAGGTYPPGTSHIQGFQAMHHTSGYGIQIAAQYNIDKVYVRQATAGTLRGWRQIITDNGSGYVGINTAAPTQYLDVAHNSIFGHAAYTHIYLRDDESTSGPKSIHANSNVIGFLNGAGSWLTYFHAGGQQLTGTLATTSDIRLKKNIQPLPSNMIDKLKLLRGVTFNWNDLRMKNYPSDPNPTQIGVIAQEVEKVFPELVNTDLKGFKSVQYDRFGPILMEAVKEQQTQIEGQQKEIADLKTEVSSMKTQLSEIKAVLKMIKK